MLDVIRANAQSWGVKIAFGIIIVVFVFWGVGGLTGGPTTVILEVNGEPVTIQDFQRRYDKYEQEIRSQYPDLDPTMLKSLQLKQQVVQQLVLESLIKQEADRLGVMITPSELRKSIEGLPYFQNAEGRFDPETYLNLLKAQNETPGHFEGQVRSTLLMNKLQQEITAGAYISETEVRDLYMYDGERRILEYVLFPIADYMTKVEVTPEQIKSYYDANQTDFSIPPQADVEYLLIGAEALAASQKIDDATVAAFYEKNAEQYTIPEQVHARHILILAAENAGEEVLAKAKAEIEALEERIVKGEDFSKLAQAFSQDGSAAQGGDLGWFAREQMVAPFADTAFALKPGEVSKPVKTQFGYHLIKLEEHKSAGKTPLAEVSDTIRKRLATEEATGKVQEALEQVQLGVIGGKSLDEAGTPFNLKSTSTGLMNTADLAQSIGLKPENVTTLLAAKPGTVLDTPFVTKQGYALVKVKDIKPQSVKTLADVSDTIKTRLQSEEARKLALEDATAVRKTVTADLPDALKKRVVRSEAVNRAGLVPKLGQNAELGTAAFSFSVNDWLPAAYALDDGAVLARLVEVVKPSEETWKAASGQIQDAVLNAKREQMFRGFLSLLRDQAKVEMKNETILQD